MALITSAFTSVIIIAAVSVIPALFRRKSKTIKARTKENGEKYIDYASFVFWFIYGVGALFSILGILVYLFSDEPLAGIAFVVMGLIFFIPVLFLQFTDTTVNWTSDYICGAMSAYRFKKNRILWENIVTAQYHANHTLQLKDASGKSVFWSVYHNGWHAVIDDLRRIRPDIDATDFD